MCVLRRLDAVLEPSKEAVHSTKKLLDVQGITGTDDQGRPTQYGALCAAAGQAFYNTSQFSLRALKSRANRQQLVADFQDYLDGFSPNVQDIIKKFDFRHTLEKLASKDLIGPLVEKFCAPELNL